MAAPQAATVGVWAWSNRGHRVPYDAPVSNAIERAFADRGASSVAPRTLDLGPLCGNLTGYEVDVVSRTQTNLVTGYNRTIERVDCSAASPLAHGICWEYVEISTWLPYSVDACEELELAFSNGQSSVDFARGRSGLAYFVNLATMCQTNPTTGFTRQIRRRLGPPYGTLPPASSPPSDGAAVATSSNPGASSLATAQGTRMSTRSKSSTSSASSTSAVAAMASLSTSAAVATATPSTSAVATSSSATTTSSSLLGPLSAFCQIASVPQDNTDDCSICLCPLAESSAYGDASMANAGGDAGIVASLSLCRHLLHLMCLKQMHQFKQQSSGFACPVCNVIHGVKQGNQPDGTMTVDHQDRWRCEGYPDVGVIVIQYNIPPGIQGPEHPAPGQAYRPRGFPRVCYVPRTAQGLKVVRLLRVAWDRRLIFTVGSSSTTGETDVVTWNEIHHKTEWPGNFSGHGYPDASYLDNVTAELAAQGVTEADLA